MTDTGTLPFNRYESWLHDARVDADLKEDLLGIQGNETAIIDRFYRDLEFGTGGLRGVLGAGTNRMNVHTVRRATLGLARHVLKTHQDGATRGVAIGYDCRRMSDTFAQDVGQVLAAAGVKAYVFPHLCPTPELSYVVRELHAAAGIMITASHNPPEYNGYKVYGQDGCQVLPDEAASILGEIEAIEDMFAIPTIPLDVAVSSGTFVWLDESVDHQYYARVVSEVQVPSLNNTDREQLKVVFTPLHGTGNVPVQEVLQRTGYTQVWVVPTQEKPDGEFSTVKSPNPEEHEALTEAIQLGRDVGADVIMGTDPDADRVGVAVRNPAGDYELLSGNQTGGLLVDFWLSQLQKSNQLPENAVVFKTIVTSELGARAAKQYGVQAEDTLTGFKYIGERITHYEQTHEKQFVFGYEESYGYLVAPFVRDKDAVQSCLLVAEMAAYYKANGMTLVEALEDLYQRVGYHQEQLVSVTLPGLDGVQKIGQMMQSLRTGSGLHVDGYRLTSVEDYEKSSRVSYEVGDQVGVSLSHGRNDATGIVDASQTALALPKADVLKYFYISDSADCWIAVRPSGTEPKIKLYLGVTAPTSADCRQHIATMRQAVDSFLVHWK